MITLGKQILSMESITPNLLLTFKQCYQIEQPQQIPPYCIPESITLLGIKEIAQQVSDIPQYIPLLHSLAHIEYNATKAYVDTIIRFIHVVPREDQQCFFNELSQIAYEESQHFTMIQQIVKYGTLPVHNNLQSRIVQSSDSLLGRLAVVAIVNEGRGMDTGEGLIQKLLNLKHKESADIVKQIVRDESRHVEIGLRWFNMLSVNPQIEFMEHMTRYGIKCTWKINEQKRRKAGFNEEWMQMFRMWK